MQITNAISWSLVELLEGWAKVQAIHTNTMISGLSLDSRSTKPGDLFFAMRGLQQHGLEYSQYAIANGAAAIAWEPDQSVKQDRLPSTIPCVPIPVLQQKVGAIAQRFYHHPSADINVIGVTGTDGKTSVSQFVAQAFEQLKISCGVIGTLGYGVYPDFVAASHTTPDAIRIQRLLHDFFARKVSNAVIEASSHGLKQGRLNSVAISTAVFTNLGRDHMDYHSSLEDYGNSKTILFHMPNLQNAVINIDDEFGCRLANDLDKQVNVIRYSCNNQAFDNKTPEFGAYIYAQRIRATQDATVIEVNSSWGNATIESKLYGRYNVSNIFAAMGALLASGCSFQDAVKAISSVQTVPGRMERVTEHKNAPTVIVDYAHTPQALKNVLQVVREQCVGKLWCVFGCGGDRDPGKRALMAQAVEQFADYAVVTDDNPRSEDPIGIAEEVISGFSSAANYSLVHDRQQAIAYAIHGAACEDTVVIAGKGHEAMQIIKDTQVPFDDKKIAAAFLQSYLQ